MGAGVERPETVNFDIPPRSFTMILLTNFEFEDFSFFHSLSATP